MSQTKNSVSEAKTDVVADSVTTVLNLRNTIREFVDERHWQKFHNAKNLSMALTIEAGELMEHFQWLTTDEVVGQTGFDRNEVAEELADVVCYALSLANVLEIDISQAVQGKMVKNRCKYPVPIGGDGQTSAAQAND